MTLILIISISDFGQQQQHQAWPARARNQANVQQVIPQVAKYGGEQRAEVVQHGDHYHVQQPRRQDQRQVYQPVGAWNNYNQNEIQDFYRQRAGHGIKDF